MRLTKVEVLRESVKIVVAALSEKSVPVTQIGMNAYVNFDKRTGRPIRVNIPFIPDNASDKLVDAVQGFVDHECAHILFTDYRALKKAVSAGVANTHNILEDLYIERNMRELYRGSRHNLKKVWGFLATDIIAPKLEEAIADGSRVKIIGAGLPIALHALGGNEAAEEFMADKWEHFEEIRSIIGEDLLDQLTEPESSDDCLKLAVAIQNRINDWREEEKRKEAEEREGPGEEGIEGARPSTSDGTDMELGDEFDDVLSTPEEGDGEPEDGEESEEESEESEGSGESEEEDESEGEYEMGDAGLSEDEDEEGEEEETDAEDEEGKKSEVDSKADEILEGLSKMDDLEGEASRLIAEEMEEALATADYWPITKDHDKIQRYTPGHVDTSYVTKSQDKVHKHVGALQKHLERLIAAKSHNRHIPGFRSGRLNGAALFRVAAGDDRVFRRRTTFKTKDVDVQLVVDLSGSMSGKKVQLACECAYGLAEALDRLNINCQVVGFTTTRNDPVKDDDVHKVEREAGRSVSRTEAIYMPIMKDWGQRFNADRKVATLMAAKDVMLLNNVDGECIEYAARSLANQPGTRKLMIVLSDGEPCAAGDMRAQAAHLKRVVKRFEKEGMEIFGIGIMDRAVSRYYTHYEVVDNVDELPTKVMTRLEKMLLGNRM